MTLFSPDLSTYIANSRIGVLLPAIGKARWSLSNGLEIIDARVMWGPYKRLDNPNHTSTIKMWVSYVWEEMLLIDVDIHSLPMFFSLNNVGLFYFWDMPLLIGLLFLYISRFYLRFIKFLWIFRNIFEFYFSSFVAFNAYILNNNVLNLHFMIYINIGLENITIFHPVNLWFWNINTMINMC